MKKSTMPAEGSPSNKKLTWMMIGGVLGGLVLAVLIWWVLDQNPQTGKISSSDLALILLSEEDIASATDAKGRVRAQLIELNDHMEPEEGGAAYKTFVGRVAVDRVTSGLWTTNAVLLFETADQAKNFMTVKAAGHDALSLQSTYADESLAYYAAESETEAASVTLRMVDGTIGGKIQVFDIDGTVTSEDQAMSELLPIAEKLAKKQASRISDLLLGTTRFSNEIENKAMQQLPETVEGATEIGRAKVKDTEWLAITGDLTTDNFPGFASGSLARFRVDSRPDEAVEVTVLEFKTAEQAKEVYDKFLTEGVAVDENVDPDQLTLPEDLRNKAAGLLQDTVAEVQSAQGKFLVDVAIVSPFATIDQEAAQEQVVTVARSVLASFEQ